MKFIIKLLIPLLFISCNLFSQNDYISCKVVDSISREPLAFVTIVYNNKAQGVVTNLDGIFRISRSKDIQFLNLRYIGYVSKTIKYTSGKFVNNQVILLSPEMTGISEVVVYPSENPAHRIIKKASENRLKNNPEKSGPFSYISYDKMVFDVESDSSGSIEDSSYLKGAIPDTLTYGIDRKGKIDLQRFLDKQYLFMMESVSKRKFLSPEKNKEEIIASKVSGLSQPTFMIMARQFQSFSFYENFVTIADRQFLNPISTGSTDKYFFLIEDTLFNERQDTVFIISFRPYKGRNFDGMKGVLYINTNGYAIQNVLAEAYDKKDAKISVSIQQQYDFVHNSRWFPVLLNTTIRFNPAKMGFQDVPLNIVGTGKTYLVNIDFNPEIEKSEFSDVQIQVTPDAHKQPDEVWNKYRSDSLTKREIDTYHLLDSLGKAEHLDRTIISFETLLTGYFPGKYWNFDIRRFIDYNSYEGFRLGAGGKTTSLLSKWFSIGGYLAYGFKDKAYKYSSTVTLNLWPKHELELAYMYRNDVLESGGIRFNETWNINGSSFLRNYMIELMDKTRGFEVSLSFKLLKYLKMYAYISQSNIKPTNNYGYSVNDGNPLISLTSFDITESGVMMRFAYKETFMKTPRGNKFSMGTNYPVVYLNIAQGNNWLNGNFKYLRTDLKITKTFKTKSFGETRIAMISGLVNEEAPYSKLYSGLGSYKSFPPEIEQSFGTMRFNEFLSDKFVGVFIKQNFGKLLFKPKGKFQPEIALVHNIGFGSLKNEDRHENISFKTMEKGYFEGGLLINNIFRVQLFRYGLGVLYRYGPYSYYKSIDNFAFKFTLQFNL